MEITALYDAIHKLQFPLLLRWFQCVLCCLQPALLLLNAFSQKGLLAICNFTLLSSQYLGVGISLVFCGSVVFTACSELCKLLFLALSVSFFVCE